MEQADKIRLSRAIFSLMLGVASIVAIFMSIHIEGEAEFVWQKNGVNLSVQNITVNGWGLLTSTLLHFLGCYIGRDTPNQ